MKILLINDYGVEIGGAETYVFNLKKALQKRGHEVLLLTSDYQKCNMSLSDFTFNRVDQRSRWRIFPYIFNLSSRNMVQRIIKEFQPDIVHLHYIFYHTSPSVLSVVGKIPVVMTLHAHEVSAPVGLYLSTKCNHDAFRFCIHCARIRYIPEVLKRIIFKYYSKKIKLFIAPSHYYFEKFQKLGLKNLVHLRNGFDLFDYSPLQYSKQVLYIGRLDKDKGTIYAIRAMQKVIKKIPDAKLVIVGSGTEENYIKEYIHKEDLHKNIIMEGKISHDKVYRYFQKSDIVIVPSICPDNLPSVCIEAMSVGRPILGFRVGGIPELVKDNINGRLIRLKDENSMAYNIIDLLSDSITLQKLSNNCVNMSKMFHINTHVNKILNLYNKILSI